MLFKQRRGGVKNTRSSDNHLHTPPCLCLFFLIVNKMSGGCQRSVKSSFAVLATLKAEKTTRPKRQKLPGLTQKEI
jgi:hypothetical protein